MKAPWRTAAGLLGAALLASCSSIRVDVDHDEAYDFAPRKTYAWTEGIPAQNGLIQKRIVEGVDRALAGCGLTPAGDDPPDLWVATKVGGRQEIRSSGGSTHVGMGRRGSRGGMGVATTTPVEIYEVTVGVLVIELFDGETEEVVWRAAGEKTVTNDSERTSKKISEMIEKAFSEFPP